jgi:hypothetical protein
MVEVSLIKCLGTSVMDGWHASSISVPPPQSKARMQWAITHVDGQQAMLTGGSALPANTDFGANVSLLMAEQQCKLVAEAVTAVEPEKVAVPD